MGEEWWNKQMEERQDTWSDSQSICSYFYHSQSSCIDSAEETFRKLKWNKVNKRCCTSEQDHSVFDTLPRDCMVLTLNEHRCMDSQCF